MEIDMTREEAIKELRGFIGQLTEGCQEVIKVLVPELRESEDERIRRAIVETIKQCPYDFLNPKNRDKMLAYLEKQKEQIPYTDFVIKPHKGDDNNPYDMGFSEAQEYATKRGFGVPFIDGEVYVDERHIIQTVGNIIRWADEHPKEQKPAERSLEDDHIIGFIYDLLNEIEWKDTWAMSKDECLRRLYNYRPQPKQEWSEEDEIKLKLCEDSFLVPQTRQHLIQQGLTPGDMVSWLKSLRPQIIDSATLYTIEQVNEKIREAQEWSEEDEKMLNLTKTQLRILQSHLSHTHSERMADMEYSSQLIQIERCVSWLDIRLKSLSTSWKPSEEQMIILSWAANGMVDKCIAAPEMRAVLRELYEQLKRL
jgi:hypothetical protein